MTYKVAFRFSKSVYQYHWSEDPLLFRGIRQTSVEYFSRDYVHNVPVSHCYLCSTSDIWLRYYCNPTRVSRTPGLLSTEIRNKNIIQNIMKLVKNGLFWTVCSDISLIAWSLTKAYWSYLVLLVGELCRCRLLMNIMYILELR